MPFADELIGTRTAEDLVSAIHAVVPDAPLGRLRAAPGLLAPLSLRERSDLLRDALLEDLPGDYPSLARTIRAARDTVPLFRGWMIWPVTSAVALRGIGDGTDESFDDAMLLLSELTSLLTSEFAIRLLLTHDLDRALTTIQGWTTSGDPAVRRLASEGTRPFLPWSRRVQGILDQPLSTVPILDALYRDESEDVRRSVANHLNDLSRQQPELVVETAGRWLAHADEHTARLVRHGLRTLVKKGDPGALGLLGFTAGARLRVDGPVLSAAEVPFGGVLAFTATVRNAGTEPVRLAIDYVVHHTRANGGQTGKTFKLTTATLAPGEALALSREHSFREITTRRYYPGAHALELQINGVVSGRAEFSVRPA